MLYSIGIVIYLGAIIILAMQNFDVQDRTESAKDFFDPEEIDFVQLE